MAKQTRKVKKIGHSGFVIGWETFEKISSIEGIVLSKAMKRRASDSKIKGLSAAETREIIIRSYRKG